MTSNGIQLKLKPGQSHPTAETEEKGHGQGFKMRSQSRYEKIALMQKLHSTTQRNGLPNSETFPMQAVSLRIRHILNAWGQVEIV